MAIQQQGTGYRDPAKSLSIKALQARSKAAAETAAQSMQMQTPISDPWQGAAHLSGVLGSSINRGRAEAEEGAGRARLAEIVAGIDPVAGPTQQQQAEIRMLDEDFANKIYEDAMETRRQEDQQKHALELQTGQQTFTSGENEKSREATSEENELNRQADIKRQEIQDANADNRQDDAQRATAELAELNARLGIAGKEADQRIKTEAIPKDTAAREAEADRLGLKPGPERDEFILTGDISKPSSTYIGGEQPAFTKETEILAAKRLDEYTKAGNDAAPFMAQLKIVSDLGKAVGTGKWAEVWQTAGPYVEMLGVDVEGLGEGQAYKAIVDKLAPNMRVAGAGPSSDFDARQFLNSLPRLGNDPVGNKIIEDTFAALTQNKVAAAEIAAKAQGRQINPATGNPYTPWEVEAEIRALPDPYETFKKFQAEGAEPPADTGEGGGGGGAYQPPVFDPATDEEGDTGTDEKGTWTVQGGKWVLTAPAGAQ